LPSSFYCRQELPAPAPSRDSDKARYRQTNPWAPAGEVWRKPTRPSSAVCSKASGASSWCLPGPPKPTNFATPRATRPTTPNRSCHMFLTAAAQAPRADLVVQIIGHLGVAIVCITIDHLASERTTFSSCQGRPHQLVYLMR